MDKEIQEIATDLRKIPYKDIAQLSNIYLTEALVKAMGVIADKLERIATSLEKQYKYGG